ncbi:uncharacterized protein LOC116132394 [Pistacia vera]|uniref:uncharacterized protein LOC116132394 n=1 Tax=Pistacia vera TaxID=55513 RepID=UPI0012634D79|nr:uncharacterized protein LOC116132394 [Pistacia vera]
MHISLEKVQQLWNGWEIRLLVLLSLLFQMILILFGSRRKYIVRGWMLVLIWSSYLAADWIATVALGHLATSQEDIEENNCTKSSYQLQAFWAPFLLLHLGGPDTITAYSLEDNELWPRHFLGLLVQVGVAFYVLLRSRSNTGLTYLAIPMFISGIIKYGERTLVLWSSSTEKFRDNLLLTHDPSPDLVQLTKEEEINEEVRKDPLVVAYFLFKRFTHLFAGLPLNEDEWKLSDNIFEKKTAEVAFDLVAIELGFMYDFLYTKATIIYSRFGIVLRITSFLSSVCALVFFSIIVDVHAYSPIDLSITYVLLFGAVVLEVYAFILHFFSDWTKLINLIMFKKANHNVCTCPSPSVVTSRKRWSGYMGQFNLLSFCLREISTSYVGIHKLLAFNELLEKYQYLSWAEIDLVWHENIFQHLLKKMNEFELLGKKARSSLLAKKGEYVFKNWPELEGLANLDLTLGFGDSLIAWHFVTDICYCEDLDKDEDWKISRRLADYMLYLLVFCPSVMPEETGEVMFTATCARAMRLFRNMNSSSKNLKVDACKLLREVREKVSSSSSSSSPDDASVDSASRDDAIIKLAIMIVEKLDEVEEKWKVMSEYWLQTLIYVAANSEWKDHGQQLKNGGELLTHVKLLMVHLGLSKDYLDPEPSLP